MRKEMLTPLITLAYARNDFLTRNKVSYADLTVDNFCTRPQRQLTRSIFYMRM